MQALVHIQSKRIMLEAPPPLGNVSFTLELEDGDYKCSLLALSSSQSRPGPVEELLNDRVLCPAVEWRFALPIARIPFRLYLLFS